jgi:hypothetical protein
MRTIQARGQGCEITALLRQKDNLMDSNDVAPDDFARICPQMIRVGSEHLFAAAAAAKDTDKDAVWVAGLESPVSLAYRRAAALLSIYRSRIDFLDQSKLDSGIRTN